MLTVGHLILQEQVAKRNKRAPLSEIASEMSMSDSQLRHLLTARRMPTLRQAIAINEKLKIPVRHWLKATETRNGKSV